jgi:hypothetical protein
MVEVASTFRDVLEGRAAAEDGRRRLASVYPGVPFANGFLHAQPGFSYVSTGCPA